MLIYGIKLSILAAMSICVASMLGKNLFFSDVVKKILAVWVLVLPFIFIIMNEPLSLWASLIILFLINRPNKPIFALVFFIVVLGAVPDWLEQYMSMPGIQYLLRLSYDKVATIAILLPIFFSLKYINRLKWNITDTLVVVFVIFMTLLTFRDGKLTTVLRFSVDTFLIYVVPNVVFSRVIKNVKDLHYCSLAFLMLAILLSVIFFTSQVIQIDIYETLNPRSHSMVAEFRGGFLRLSGPFMGILVGFSLVAG